MSSNYTIRFEDEEKEVLSFPGILLNSDVSWQFFETFRARKILRPLFIDIGDGECVCPTGSIILAQTDQGVYYCQDGVKVLKLADAVDSLQNPIVLKLCTNPSKNAYS